MIIELGTDSNYLELISELIICGTSSKLWSSILTVEVKYMENIKLKTEELFGKCYGACHTLISFLSVRNILPQLQYFIITMAMPYQTVIPNNVSSQREYNLYISHLILNAREEKAYSPKFNSWLPSVPWTKCSLESPPSRGKKHYGLNVSSLF